MSRFTSSKFRPYGQNMKELTKNILSETLETLKDLGEFLPRLGETPYMHGQRLCRRTPSYSTLYRLEKKGLAVKRRVGKNVSYRISKEGRKIIQKIDLPQKRLDGLSTVIMFDVPEIMHGQRNSLRRSLLKSGYTMLQRSVFISPNWPSRRLLALVSELKIREFVTILDAKTHPY